jgi:tripartite-type tricarboxylate transporter receptor subunit TctC
MRITRRGTGIGALAAAAAAAALPARAQQGAWPERNIRFIVPFPPGGAADLVGRMLATHLQGALGRPVVVENRGGAGSAIGVDALAKSAPDGHTIGLINIAANAILPAVRRQPLPYRPVEDFAPISNLAVTPALLLVNPQRLPGVRGVADLVAAAKARPDAINFGSSGVGSSLHLGMELFMQKAGIRMTHVPFSGGGPLLQALTAGTVEVSLDVAATTAQLLREGRIRALATTAPARLADYPDLPALNETYPGAELASWHGLAAPAGTPAPVLDRLAAETGRFLALPETRERYKTLFLEMPQHTDPAAFAAFMRRELESFRELARAANIVVE